MLIVAAQRMLLLLPLLCACDGLDGNGGPEHRDMRGYAKAAASVAGEGADGSMEGMYLYTVQKIESLAEKLDSLATISALNLERITRQAEETAALRRKVANAENEQTRGAGGDEERRKMLKQLASELQQLKLAEAKEDVVDHKEKLEQGALAEEVREILSMQRLADEQESEQVNGLLANLLVKNGLNIAVLVGIVYFLFVRADDGGGGDDGNDGTGDGRSGGRHGTGGGRRHGRGWRRGGARHNSSRGNSRRDGDGGGGGGGDGNGGGRWASRFWPESWDLARNDKSHDNNQQNDQQPHEDNAPVDAGGARGAWPSSRLAPSSYERNLPLAGPRLHVASIDRTDGDGDNLSVVSTYSTDPFSGRRQLQIEGPGGGDGLKPPSHGSLRSNRASRISSTSRTHSFKSHGGGGGRSGIRSSRGSFRTKAM